MKLLFNLLVFIIYNTMELLFLFTRNNVNTTSRSTSPFAFEQNNLKVCGYDDPCSIRIRELEMELSNMSKSFKLNSKDSNTISKLDNSELILHKPNHQNQTKLHCSSNSGRKSKVDLNANSNSQEMMDLVARLTLLKQENHRLTNTLKEEDRMKQELMTAYHSSLKEITELNGNFVLIVLYENFS